MEIASRIGSFQLPRSFGKTWNDQNFKLPKTTRDDYKNIWKPAFSFALKVSLIANLYFDEKDLLFFKE